jgi:glycosidase
VGYRRAARQTSRARAARRLRASAPDSSRHAGGDFESLKEFVTALPEVRSALIRCYQYAIANWDVDGFRIDTLKYIEPDFALLFGNAMREFALQIGKRNFFTFGEVYDDEYKIAQFVGRRRTSAGGDMIGVDAALDFPLFYRLPGVAKGLVSPSQIAEVYALRRRLEEGIVSSHGEAGRFFVTFLDNHDQHSRLRYIDAAQPDRYDGQVPAALACLFSLQGIPCVYYGTEQGLAGSGSANEAVREALWGKPGAFDETDPFYIALRDIAHVRAGNPALRYGRQYFRPISGEPAKFRRIDLRTRGTRLLAHPERERIRRRSQYRHGGRSGSFCSCRLRPKSRRCTLRNDVFECRF